MARQLNGLSGGTCLAVCESIYAVNGKRIFIFPFLFLPALFGSVFPLSLPVLLLTIIHTIQQSHLFCLFVKELFYASFNLQRASQFRPNSSAITRMIFGCPQLCGIFDVSYLNNMYLTRLPIYAFPRLKREKKKAK